MLRHCSTPQGQQLEYLLTQGGGADVLFQATLEQCLKTLQAERDADAALEASLLAAASKGEVEDWAADPVLLKRIAAVKEGERGALAQEAIYLLAVRRLLHASFEPVHNLSMLEPGNQPAPQRMITQQRLQQKQQPTTSSSANGGSVSSSSASEGPSSAGTWLHPALADVLAAYVVSIMTDATMGGKLPPTSPLSMDRVQGARLYAGLLEFGHFSRGLQARVEEEGRLLGRDASVLIAAAAALPEAELKSLRPMSTDDAWVAAVRHTGALFQLPQQQEHPQFDTGAYDEEGGAPLPYPQLATTINSVEAQPEENIAEHYSAPGTAQAAAARAQEKAARGWAVDVGAAPTLPEADLLMLRMDLLGALLLEAAVLGAALWEAAQQVQQEYGYALRARRGGGEGQQEQRPDQQRQQQQHADPGLESTS